MQVPVQNYMYKMDGYKLYVFFTIEMQVCQHMK